MIGDDFDTTPEVTEMMDRMRVQHEAVEQVQRDVEALQVTGYSRSNEVSATVRGIGRFTGITIDPDTVRQFDAYELGSIVLEAVNDALARLSEETAAKYAPVLAMPLPENVEY